MVKNIIQKSHKIVVDIKKVDENGLSSLDNKMFGDRWNESFSILNGMEIDRINILIMRKVFTR